VLTYLARGLHAEVALLSLTRGEGGQNDLGPEQAPQLGLIRSQELLGPREAMASNSFYSRSRLWLLKTPKKLKEYGATKVLQDMVEVIRSFRPTVVINGWGGVHSGSRTSIKPPDFYTESRAACPADPITNSAFPHPAARRGDLGRSPPICCSMVDRGEKPQGYPLPLDDVSTLYGKSWREIGLDAFANHRTQGITGFLNSPFSPSPITSSAKMGATSMLFS